MIRTAALVLLCLAAPVAAAEPEEAIRRVEAGLLPAVTIVGKPTQFMSLPDRMAHHKVPAVSVAVIDKGKIAWTRAYGVLKVGGSPATPGTLFQAASISKPVAAAAALSLVHHGRVGLDAPVNDHLKSWKIPDSDFTKERPVTLRQILSHSAGLTVHGFGGYAAGKPVPTLEQVLSGSPPANSKPVLVDQRPGSAWRYSGGGTSVAQLLMQDVTGQPFAAFMRQTVLQPAGMTSSGYEQPLPAERLPLAAVAHRADGNAIEGDWHVYPEQAAAGLWTTPTDLARFATWVIRGLKDRSAAPDHRAVARLLTEPQPGIETAPGQPMGLGFFLSGKGPSSSFSHGGANAGYRAHLVAFPEIGKGAVVMTNSDNGGPLVQEIVRSIAMEYGWPEKSHSMMTVTDVAPEALEPLAGRYKLGPQPTDELAIAVEGGQLQARSRGGPPVPLWAESPTSFVRPDIGLRLRFSLGASGSAESVTIEPIGGAGRPVVAPRLPEAAN